MSRIIALLVLVPVLLTAQVPARVPADAGGGEWLVEGTGRSGDMKIDTFLGRRSVWLRNGTQAIMAGTRLVDGTIEFDVAPMDHGDFVAVVFRRESLANHENVYLRPRSSGEFMALQYAPRMNGSSTWQLYPEFTGRTAWPRNQWTHVRMEVSGSRLEIFVADGAAPVVSVPRLRHGSTTASEIAFWARVNDKPAEWAAAISNIQVRPSPSAMPRSDAEPPSPTYVSSWQVAGPAKAPDAVVDTVPPGLDWKPIAPEESGLVNLNALFAARAQQRRFTAYGRTFIEAPAARRVLAGIGYSDDVTVFVNGEPVYSGINGWNSRTPDYLGFVNADFERVWLPLKAGRNEIVLAVTDNQVFGWGFAVKLLERASD
jgi:hypothetical protein